ncbi:MAG: serine hydrolase domain-containing protein [Phycisphaerales bacterium]
MKNAVALTILACVLAPLALAGVRLGGPDADFGVTQDDALAQAAAVASARLESGALHGVVGLLAGDGATAVRAAGLQSLPDGLPINGATRFRIASLTKVLTRIAVLRLVDEGRLSLDDTLALHRPGLDAPWADAVTIRQLLTFRSGLARERAGAADPIEAGVTLDADGRGLPFLDTLVDDGPTVAPGTRVLYSNLGYFHLGGVVESATGLPLEEAIGELILAPAGMRRTTLGDSDPADRSSLASGHIREPDGSIVPTAPFPIEGRYAAGGFVSTAEDLLALSRALLGGRLLSPESLRLLVREFGADEDDRFRVAGLVPGFACVWSIALEPPSAVLVLNNVVPASPSAIVDAHDEIAGALRAGAPASTDRTRAREADGWRALRRPADWPSHTLMEQARAFFEVSRSGDAEALFRAGLAIRGCKDEAVDAKSREAYRWMADYQVALRDRYGPFELAWWRPGERDAFEFLLEGPDGRALRITLRPSESDPRVTSTLAIATMGFDADSSLYEGLSDE